MTAFARSSKIDFGKGAGHDFMSPYATLEHGSPVADARGHHMNIALNIDTPKTGMSMLPVAGLLVLAGICLDVRPALA